MDFSHKKILNGFKDDIKFAKSKIRSPERIAEMEELFQCLRNEYDFPIMHLIDELKRGPLRGSSLWDFGNVLMDYLENERVVSIMSGDVWENEETAGPVSLEGVEALHSDDFVNEASAFLDKSAFGKGIKVTS